MQLPSGNYLINLPLLVKSGSDRLAERSQSQSVNDLNASMQQEAIKRVLEELQATHDKVHAHQKAHQIAGGPYIGAANFTYQQGSDGKYYAVGGDVSIDISPVPGDPEKTLQKAEQIQKAAMAPSDPSMSDLAVATKAAAIAIQARIDIENQKIKADDADRYPAQTNLVSEDNKGKIFSAYA